MSHKLVSLYIGEGEYYARTDTDNVLAEKDKEIAQLQAMLEERNKEVGQLLMKIAGLEKLVETADKLLKPSGGFEVKDITFNGVKLEGLDKEAK